MHDWVSLDQNTGYICWNCGEVHFNKDFEIEAIYYAWLKSGWFTKEKIKKAQRELEKSNEERLPIGKQDGFFCYLRQMKALEKIDEE